MPLHKQRECPECESRNVEPDTTSNTVFSHGDVSTWTCNKCGISGIFPEINQDEEQKTQQKELTKVDNRYSKKFLVTLFLLTLIVLLIAAAYLN